MRAETSKNFECQAFDKAAYREPADDWSIDPKSLTKEIVLIYIPSHTEALYYGVQRYYC